MKKKKGKQADFTLSEREKTAEECTECEICLEPTKDKDVTLATVYVCLGCEVSLDRLLSQIRKQRTGGKKGKNGREEGLATRQKKV